MNLAPQRATRRPLHAAFHSFATRDRDLTAHTATVIDLDEHRRRRAPADGVA